METRTLDSFVGLHKLTGVDMEKTVEWDLDAQMINFVLDGKTYTAMENPSDGYRSMLDYIIPSDHKVKNTFPPCKVLCVMRPETHYYKDDTLDFYDVATGKVVLSIGTDNSDDYYPCFVAKFNPENMAINKGK